VSADADVKRLRLRIRGRVQGVNFRYFARQEARRLGVHGWVRNRPDGQVEVVAEDGPDAVAAFAAWCRRGPPAAQVEGVEEDELAGPVRYPDFRVVDRAPE
jgi:acylphosphatase